MAVWPFCLPWPRTSVTVIPEMFSFWSASRTSSTLLGRTIALINFIASLQHVLQVGRQRRLRRIRQLGPARGDVKHVDRLLAFGGDQDQIDVAAMTGHYPADSMQESDRVAGDDIQNRVTVR